MRTTTLLLVCLALVACGDDDTTPDMDVPDMGMDTAPDEGVPDMMMRIGACEPSEIETVVGVMGETQSVRADTSAIDTAPIDLGPACGNVEADRPAPQLIIEYQVPGSGEVAVEFTAITDGTEENFDTVVQVRETCAGIPASDAGFPGTCFDDTGSDLRSSGAVPATGGSTLFFVVTGYAGAPADGSIDEGMVQLDVTTRENTAPTLTTASGLHFEVDTRLNATGSDPDGDVQGLFVAFLDASDELFDLNGDGEANDEFFLPFDEDASGMTDWAGEIFLRGVDAMSRGAVRARVQAFDAVSLSDPMTFEFGTGTVVGLGEACDSEIICTAPLTCEMDLCVAPEDVVTACEAPTAVEFTDGSASITGTLMSGAGAFTAGCIDRRATPGLEAIYEVTIPEDATFDVLATTDVAGTGETDTVLYARAVCEEARELACNDDIADMMTRSTIEILDQEAGSVFLYVEAFGGVEDGMTADFGLEIRLRTVLAEGEECDAEEVMNRCGGELTCTDGNCV